VNCEVSKVRYGQHHNLLNNSECLQEMSFPKYDLNYFVYLPIMFRLVPITFAWVSHSYPLGKSTMF